MPDFPRTARRALKVEPTNEEMLAMAIRSLERIAEGFTNIVETIDAVTAQDDRGVKYLRTRPE